MDDQWRVVIIGGGFAGLYAAKAFRHSSAAVTLIDRTDHHLFQPLLYQCATGILSEGQIATPLRYVLRRHRNVDCVLAEVVDFDLAARRVLAERPGGGRIDIPYDDLIVAAGVSASYFGHNEFARYAPGMKTVGDALGIRRRVFGAFEMAETETDPARRRRWLTFALVGAGPTGVELAGQIRELATQTLRDEFRHIDPEDARVLLFEGGPAPLAAFGSASSAKAAQALAEVGVELHMHSMVTDVDERGLLVRGDGTLTRYDAGTVLWTAGVRAPAVADMLATRSGAEQDRAGRIKVEPDCTIPGHPEISVIGDMMSLSGLPGLAEVAMQSGRYVAHRIRHDLEGRHTDQRPFRYRDLGAAAYISRGQALVTRGRFTMGGFAGWLSWLFVHVAFLMGVRNRLSTVLTWLVVFTREIRRERAFTARDITTARDVYSAASLVPPSRGWVADSYREDPAAAERNRCRFSPARGDDGSPLPRRPCVMEHGRAISGMFPVNRISASRSEEAPNVLTEGKKPLCRRPGRYAFRARWLLGIAPGTWRAKPRGWCDSTQLAG